MDFFLARVLVVVATFLVVALDGGLDTTPLLVVDELPVLFNFGTGTRGFIGRICDPAALETACFLGEIAFAVALDLTGRAIKVGFVTVVERDAVGGRIVAVLIVSADRLGFAVEVVFVRAVEATVGRVLEATSL